MEFVIHRFSGCSTPVVYAVWDRENRVRFPAPRHLKGYSFKLGEQANCFACARVSKDFSVSPVTRKVPGYVVADSRQPRHLKG